jgi:hypothetical protein
MLVIASRAATEGGMASGEWISLALRADDDRLWRTSVLFLFLTGICTALEGVVGLGAVVAMAVGGC